MVLDIRFHNSFGDFNLDIDISLPTHGVTACFGPSGSGKTSLLRAISGLMKPKTGHIIFNDQIWQQGEQFLAPHKRSLGYVFQESSLFDHMTVVQNLKYGQGRTSSPLNSQESDHIIDLLGISSLLDRRPDQLSGGERQRVAIARALLPRPKILLMDEPMASLDMGRKREILSLLERLKSELSIPMIYVSHNVDEVTRLADHLIIMDQGKIIQCGSIQHIMTHYNILNNFSDEPFSLLFGQIINPRTDHNLTEIIVAGNVIRMPCLERPQGKRLESGQEIRLHLYAKDISIARCAPQQTSVLNIVQGHIHAIEKTSQDGQCLVRLLLGDVPILARISAFSCDELALRPKMEVYAQIKAVSLVQ